MKNRLSIFSLFLIVFFFVVLYKLTRNESGLYNHDPLKIELPDNDLVKKDKEQIHEESSIILVKEIINHAKLQIGSPYKTGGTTKNGFDCSGLIMTSFKRHGVKLPRASYQMVSKGKEIILDELKLGDLLFFATNFKNPNKINHVGLVTSVNNRVVKFIHSTNKKGVIESTLEEDYYKNSFVIAKRVL